MAISVAPRFLIFRKRKGDSLTVEAAFKSASLALSLRAKFAPSRPSAALSFSQILRTARLANAISTGVTPDRADIVCKTARCVNVYESNPFQE
jgi:hypothetical protein